MKKFAIQQIDSLLFLFVFAVIVIVNAYSIQ